MDPFSAARAALPAWLPFVSLLALPVGFAAGWLARKRTRLAAVIVSSVVGALLAHLGGPVSLLGPAVVGFLGSAAALGGYALGKRRIAAPPAPGLAGRIAFVAASVSVFLAAEVNRPRAVWAISRRNPLTAVALTGGEAWPLSELGRARAAGGRPADAVAFYRAAFALDRRPSHLANAAFVENHAGRCPEALALADEAAAALAREPASPDSLESYLVGRARIVADGCGRSSSARDERD